MKQWEKIIATACVGTELLWMGTVLPAQAAPAAGHFANGAMSHRRSFLAGAFLDKGIAAYNVCDTVKVPTVIVQNSPSHRGNFPIKSGAP